MGSVEVLWIPLGAGGLPVVRWSGRAYERVRARVDHRAPRPLFHSALVACVDDGTCWTIERAPVWSSRLPGRGVVAEGPVGLRWLGRSRMFRYEVRCWRAGVIPDLEWAEDRQVLAADDDRVHQLLGLVPDVPVLTWGRDESRTGEMWNSNSLVSWLLALSSLPVDLEPPRDGRAPGWAAGVAVALSAGAAGRHRCPACRTRHARRSHGSCAAACSGSSR